MEKTAFTLKRNAFGQLEFTTPEGEVHVGVVPVRSFAITAPESGIALVSPDGHELLWVEQLAKLDPEHARLVREELASRDFMPEIRQLNSVSSFATPSVWEVETDRGPTSLTLKAEEDIRRLSPSTTLLISDSQGIHFLIRDVSALDNHSRKLLARFL